ncbi:acid-sensing ion channel 1B-like [Liolophura sinensis]|uniref:acid-sensing ion channel 1B-like n=1 Tax=Liolophura sinensis TaxID=3198878 RepID=UPI00315971D3
MVKIQPISTRFADFGLKNVSDLNDKLNKTTMQKEAEFLSVTLANNLILIKQYQTELKEYLDMNKLDGDFFLNNFLQLEVYYQDLSETLMSQHSPYGLIDLACDVGGTMALYLGASILTIFELLDFLTKALNFCLCRPRPRPPPQSSELPLAS